MYRIESKKLKDAINPNYYKTPTEKTIIKWLENRIDTAPSVDAFCADMRDLKPWAYLAEDLNAQAPRKDAIERLNQLRHRLYNYAWDMAHLENRTPEATVETKRNGHFYDRWTDKEFNKFCELRQWEKDNPRECEE